MFKVSKQPCQLPEIETFASSATATKTLYQPFEELKGSNFEFKLITPKSTTGTYFDTKLTRFGLAGFLMMAI